MNGSVSKQRIEEVQLVTAPEQWNEVRRLFADYLIELGDDYEVAGTNLIGEMAALPAPYTGQGFVMLGMVGDEAVGCLALKDMGNGAGEIRRMFVAPEGRGKGVGRGMLAALVEEARARGFTRLYLDSLHRFVAAHKIYRDAGFALTEPYDPAITPKMQEQMIFMELKL